MKNLQYFIIVLGISLFITVGGVGTAEADILKFDQPHVIIIDHSDIISFIDDSTPFETGNSVTVTITSPLESKQIQLYKEPGTNIFRTIIKFTSSQTSGSNELKVANGNTVTLSKAGFSPNDQVQIKLATGTSPSPTYGNNKFTTNSATCQPNDDADLDFICDSWESSTGLNIPYPTGGTYTLGVAPNVPGLMELRPPSPTKKDIYLEIDYMQGHRPNVESLWDVINAFDAMGITLHIQLDDEDTFDTNRIPHEACTKWPGGNFAFAKGFDQIAGSYFGTQSERNAWGTTNGWERKHQVFHYALFTHSQCGSTSSGVAEVGGDELMITLGVLTNVNELVSPDQISGTLMHELGHNLNLNHGGAYADQINCKPTHLSVMNYARQWSDLVSDRNLEYSRQKLGDKNSNDIRENALLERNGIQSYTSDPSERVVWGPTPPLNLVSTGVTDVDWNQNYVMDPNSPQIPAVNINSITSNGEEVCQSTSNTETLSGHKDTDALVFNLRADADWADGRSVGGVDIESNFCLPVDTLLSLINSDRISQQLKDFLNSIRSCAGGRGEINSTSLIQSFRTLPLLKELGMKESDFVQLLESVETSSDELTPNDMIIMRLSRIDSIMDFLTKNTNDKDFTNGDKSENLKFYQAETNLIKNSILKHKQLDTLDKLKNLVDSYPLRVANKDKLNSLTQGTSDIYKSFNKAVLGSPMNAAASPKLVYPGYMTPEIISELKVIRPDLFSNGVIKKDYKTIIKGGKFLVEKWYIDPVTDEDKLVYLKPIKMQKLVDGIDGVVCNKDLVKVIKPDGKNVICVKETTKIALDTIWFKNK